jgi:hypothetical protein
VGQTCQAGYGEVLHVLGWEESLQHSGEPPAGQTAETAPDPINRGLNVGCFQVNQPAGAQSIPDFAQEFRRVDYVLDEIDHGDQSEVPEMIGGGLDRCEIRFYSLLARGRNRPAGGINTYWHNPKLLSRRPEEPPRIATHIQQSLTTKRRNIGL